MDGQALLMNQAMPLAGCAPEKGSSQRNCRQPAECESKDVALTKAPDGQVDRETSRKQTHGVKDRRLKNFSRRRSRQTLSMNTVVAEKLEAIVSLGMLNSRMKDFYDIWFLARTFRSRRRLLVRR